MAGVCVPDGTDGGVEEGSEAGDATDGGAEMDGGRPMGLIGSGCGCSAAGGAADAWLAVLGCLALVVIGRSRRSRATRP